MSTKRPSNRHDVSTDEIFDVLGEKRRRTLLTELCSHSDSITLFALADKLSQTDANHEETIDDEVLVTLHHVDLPKLDDAGLLTYDSSHQVVRFDSVTTDFGAALEDVELALDSIRDAL
ncbi:MULTISPECIES: hypothetical protein [Haloferax]|uniref:DUF7344 domain-containing protein n=1 Tax=Haloferax marinum TaxID=2666143 RepID=A0A6A8GAJ5_9EURY|nr:MULTISPECIES: hypothetical protein [Haloferax]KAB1198038.1 hypothetical protein Hfx1150_11100 [Haloferax sp. CBA1150]MRW97106.1 hypothetical protein [Haloferax marinum]